MTHHPVLIDKSYNMSYNKEDLVSLYNFYTDQLLNDTAPFWFPRSFDEEHGGFLLMRDADGSLIDDDKAVWIQGRATWILSTLYTSGKKGIPSRRTAWI